MTVTARKGSVLFIFIVVLIDVIGFGIIIPVVPRLVMDLTGEGLSRAAIYGGWLFFAYAATQFFSAPVMGNISDRFGRRPVLLSSLTALGIDYLIMGFAPTIGWLFFGRIMAGIAGASFIPAYAYLADVTPPEKRAQNFGIVGAAFGLGFVVGPAVGGLLGELGPRMPFFFAAGLAFANVTWGFFVLPESLPKESRRPVRYPARESARRVDAYSQVPAGSDCRRVDLLLAARAAGVPEHVVVLHHVSFSLVGSTGGRVARLRRFHHGDQPGHAHTRRHSTVP
jgi:DHA1 family tetracycline resistance protein-like MFS transporter